MNIQQRGIILLMKSAITRQAYPLPEGFDLEPELPLIRKHHISAMVYDGACRCGISPQTPVMQQLFMDYCRYLRKSEAQMAAVRKIFDAFDAQGIDYMPLKGCKLKQLYPAPELRTMGDADILIRLEQYPTIEPIMRELGFQADHESDHEIVWRSDALYLELHKRVVQTDVEDFYGYFGEGWKLAKHQTGTRYAMSADDEMIYLFTHFSKHYRQAGIGCRHLTDLWVFRRANPQLNESYIYGELEKMQLHIFYENILRLMDVWFADAPSDEKMDHMTDFIMCNGSWGTTRNRLLSGAVAASKHSRLAYHTRLRYICIRLFPGVKILRGKYTILKKAPWLLPVVWLIRPFYKLLFERKSLSEHQQTLEILDEKEVRFRQEMLTYVGLDYNF